MAIRMHPFKPTWRALGTPIVFMKLLSIPSISTPRHTLNRLPSPPAMDVPPITTAVMESVLKVPDTEGSPTDSLDVYRMPTMPHSSPDMI